jgi:hypothetical protein
MYVSSPVEGDTVSGQITVGGWAHDFYSLADISFGVDSISMPVSNLQFGFSSPEACQPPSGLWWNSHCNPLSGFSGKIDTRTLANGPHTLQVVAQGSNGLPSTFERQIFVNNTCAPPIVSISAPSFTVTGSVNITADASDASGVTGVDFSVDGGYVSTVTSAPFAYRWDSTPWTSGAHVVTATAHNGCGNTASARATFTVVKDVTAPQVSLASPAQGAVVRGVVSLQAQTSDDVGTTRVEFWVDGALKATDLTPPFTYAWSTAGDGPHSLVAKAYDAAGNVGTTTANVIADNTPPQLSVSSPTYNQTVYGVSKLAGWATDRTSASLSFTMDGQLLPLAGDIAWLSRQEVCDSVPTGDARCPNVGWRGSFDTSRFVNGWHTLEVTATDGAGWTTSQRLNVYVSNTVSSSQATFTPTGDASVRQASPNSNYGTGSLLGVRYAISTGDGQYSFLKFNVTGISGTVSSAQLLLRTKTPLIEMYLYKVDSSWTETSITWNNMPFSSAVELTHRFNLAGETWYDFDITGYVTGNGIYAVGFASADTGTNLGCYSRESSLAPTLQVTYRP